MYKLIHIDISSRAADRLSNACTLLHTGRNAVLEIPFGENTLVQIQQDSVERLQLIIKDAFHVTVRS